MNYNSFMKKESKYEKSFPFTSGSDKTNKGFASEFLFIVLATVIMVGFFLLIGSR